LYCNSEPVFVDLLRSPGIDSQPGGIDSLESIVGLLKSLQIGPLPVLAAQEVNNRRGGKGRVVTRCEGMRNYTPSPLYHCPFSCFSQEVVSLTRTNFKLRRKF
jgi:hypothetical protein